MSYIQTLLLGAEMAYKYNALSEAEEERNKPSTCGRRHVTANTVTAILGMDLGPKDIVPSHQCCCKNHKGILPDCKGRCHLAGTVLE